MTYWLHGQSQSPRPSIVSSLEINDITKKRNNSKPDKLDGDSQTTESLEGFEP